MGEKKTKGWKLKVGWKKRIKWLVGGIVVLVVVVWCVRQYNSSQVFGQAYRFNLALVGENGQVVFVSFDPEEKQIFVISYPENLEIRSRSVGEYRVGSLYKLGEYSEVPGEFVRRKMQGFMRVPIEGVLIVGGESNNVRKNLRRGLWRTLLLQGEQSSLSSLDAGLLLWRMGIYRFKETGEEELVRAGVIEKVEDVWQYYPERLKQYLGLRVFDWTVGETNVTVTVLNMSREDGLGTDIAEFLSNLGLDVVAVRGVENELVNETSSILVSDIEAKKQRKLLRLLGNLFHWKKIVIGSTEEYRADIVVTLGRDGLDLF